MYIGSNATTVTNKDIDGRAHKARKCGTSVQHIKSSFYYINISVVPMPAKTKY
jgi:hypothetical protein